MPGRPGPGEIAQMFDGRFAGRGEFVGVFIAQRIELEVALLGNLDSPPQCLRIVGKEPMHLPWRFEVALAVGKQPEARFVNSAAVPNAREHVLQHPPGGIVIVNRVRCQERDVVQAREFVQTAQMRGITEPWGASRDERKAGAEGGAEGMESRHEGTKARRHGGGRRGELGRGELGIANWEEAAVHVVCVSPVPNLQFAIFNLQSPTPLLPPSCRSLSAAADAFVPSCLSHCFVPFNGSNDPLIVIQKILQPQMAFPFFGPAFSDGQHSAEPGVAGAVAGPNEQIGASENVSREPTSSLSPTAFAASWARTTPESVFTSVMPIAVPQFGGTID